MDTYRAKGDGRKFRVEGRLNEDGFVRVKTDEEQYEFRPEQGVYRTGAVSARLNRNDGAFVDEGAVSQEIGLPDGTVIEKGAVSRKVTKPNGEVIESESPDQGLTIKTTDNGLSIQYTSTKTGSTQSVQQDIGVVDLNGSTDDDRTADSASESENSDSITKDELINELTPNVVPLTAMILGFVFSSTAAFAFGLSYYMMDAVPAVIRYRMDEGGESEESTTEDSTTEVTDNIEELKEEFRTTDMTIKEFEDRLDEEITEENMDLEVETT